MLSLLKMKYNQFVEHLRQNGLISALKIMLYKYEEAVPVEKNLTSLKSLNYKRENLDIIEITADNFKHKRLHYAFKSRHDRAPGYFKKGYKSFIIIKDDQIIGDIWYVTRASAKHNQIHPHLKWFEIDLNNDEVYMFDMFVTPDKRGKDLTTYFLNSVLHKLNSRGFTKSYGYFVADYVPALWVHRLLGYKELPRCIIRRYLLLFETAKRKTA
jgi:GNAT superfamily N-acetyltransferase